VKRIVNLLGQRPVDTLDPGQVLDAGPGHLADAAQLLQQLLAPPRSDPGNLLQRRGGPRAGTPLAMPGDGEAVGLVPDLLDQVQRR